MELVMGWSLEMVMQHTLTHLVALPLGIFVLAPPLSPSKPKLALIHITVRICIVLQGVLQRELQCVLQCVLQHVLRMS